MRHTRFLMLFVVVLSPLPAEGATRHVPADHSTIQAAIEAAQPGDTVLVAPGVYRERLRLRPGVNLRSAGDNTAGKIGLQRAEATIIDGGGEADGAPGVVLANGSTLDGFTITGIGRFDEALWKTHYESQGEDLEDDDGAAGAEGTVPAVSLPGIQGDVRHCLVHDNGDVGISIVGAPGAKTHPTVTDNFVFRNLGGGIGSAAGAEPVIGRNTCRENLRAGIGCRQSAPLIVENICYQNVRAGIGCREGATPIIRGNRCYQNRRAGIGMRMKGTAPVVEGNECYENAMAGIGARDQARPVIRHNLCRENEQAGIGLQAGAVALLQGNRCIDNRLVAVGITGGATATLLENELSRSGGAPPLVAVRGDSVATLIDNRLQGGGVAAILVEGKATLRGNQFTGLGDKQGQAVWARERSHVIVEENAFVGYRTALNASQATVVVRDNRIERFDAVAIVVRESARPAHIHGNMAISPSPEARALDLQGPAGIVADNVLRAP
jgi:hypothetical protein